MVKIEGPHEILELADGESVTIHVERWEAGDITIHPTWPGAPESKDVRGLRVFVPMADKEYLPSYWDITAGHLVAGLKLLLPGLQESGKAVTITAGLMRPGDQASKRFKLELEE